MVRHVQSCKSQLYIHNILHLFLDTFYDTLCKRGKYVVLKKLCLLVTFIRAIFQPLT